MTTPLSIQAQHILGLLTTDQLPLIAQAMLSEGFESKELLRLAASSPDDGEPLRRILDDALSELGARPISPEQALRQYAIDISGLIVDKKLSPLDGAKKIWKAVINTDVSDFHELDPFIYAASEADSRPRSRRLLEKAVQDEAFVWSTRRLP